MDPRVSLPFPEWCKKISASLTAGQTFKIETAIDKYALLPAWWHGTLPADKRLIFGLIELHGGFTPQCCMDLCNQCHIPYANQQILRVCYKMARKSLEQLAMGVPSEDLIVTAQDNPEVREAYESVGRVTDGLASFELKPASKKGLELFDHMYSFLLWDPKTKMEEGVTVEPSAHLDLSISSDQRKIILQPTTRYHTMRELMKDAGGQGATMKIAQRKLNMFGAIQSHSCMANNEGALALLRNKTELVASLAEIHRLEKANQQAKTDDALKEKQRKAPAALEKLRANDDNINKLTKLEIAAVLLVHYSKDENEKIKKKPYLVDMLRGCIQRQPDGLGTPVGNVARMNPTKPGDPDLDVEEQQHNDDEPAGHTQEPNFAEDQYIRRAKYLLASKY
jgi:hypothetical protein